jgi:hypothetical protein
MVAWVLCDAELEQAALWTSGDCSISSGLRGDGETRLDGLRTLASPESVVLRVGL